MQDGTSWYKDAIIYELHVRAFYDSDGDGIGDFKGLGKKLDYLQDLGVTTIWLLPFYPSPLRDDGYDISDYVNIRSSYGDLSDFREFLREARRRGLRVVTELVLNHTSDQHPWFQTARRSPPGSRLRDFYVWSDNPHKYKDARVIFSDFEASNWTWDPLAKAYYWHRFYSHQPDLNFENPDVRKALFRILDFWLEMGVDGLRLDAVPYLYEREGTNCENLSATHAFLKEVRRHVDKKHKNRMLLAEANQWPEEAAAYFGSGDECHMAFHFPIMPRMFMAVHMEDRFPIVDILQQTPSIPETGQWALFLRNHDELTLEMVTDEERDYMYRVYAMEPQSRVNFGIRRRLAPLLGNNRRKIELMNGLLLSLPGTPVIYYGDEIGMGDNIYLGDRNGVRTPMQWSGDRNAGFSRANAQQLYLPVNIEPEYHYEALNVEAQQNNLHSLFWWMKRVIALRKKYKAFGRGSIEFLHSDNRKILTFVRSFEEERLLVVANLSRFVQFAELDLSLFKGMRPVELFGRTEFPLIGELPYFVTLGPHSFYWFDLKPALRPEVEISPLAMELPLVNIEGDWEDVFVSRKAKSAFEETLPAYLKNCRWFGAKGRRIKQARITEAVPFRYGQKQTAYTTLLQVEYLDGVPETYHLSVAFASGGRAKVIRENHPHAAAALLRCSVRGTVTDGLLYDAITDTDYCEALLDSVQRRRKFKGGSGEVLFTPTRVFRELRGKNHDPLPPSVVKTEQSNSSILFGDRLILKIFRRLEEGTNPDLEIGRFLTEKKKFPYIPPVGGALEYIRAKKQPVTLGILQGFVANQGDAWNYTLDAVGPYYERVLAQRPDPQDQPVFDKGPLGLVEEEINPLAVQLIGTYLETARLLGRRTAQLHMSLTQESQDPGFTPESFSVLYQRSLYQSMRNLTTQVFYLIRKRLKELPREAKAIVDSEGEVLKRFQALVDKKFTGMRIRCHGDFHLGQVLYTGKDFVIIDFEGEPARSLHERRIKKSPLCDVAGMLRSFHYAAYTGLLVRSSAVAGIASTENISHLEPWADFWYQWVSSAFLRSYLSLAKDASLLPKDRSETELLLNVYLLEKAIYEMNYELNHRPDWMRIPLRGISQLLKMKA